MTENAPLFQSFADGVLTLTLNRPERANAFNLELTRALQKALKQAASDPQVRCVVLRGQGDFFSAGQDLGEMAQAGEISYYHHLQRTYNPLILQIRRLEKPVLASLRGAVAGAALGVALACDLRIAAEGTRFTVGFLGIGLAPDSGVSLLLPMLIGLGRASELAFSNAPFTAEQALAWGLVNRVVPAAELDAATTAWAAELARGPLQAIGLSKRAFNRALLPQLEEVLDYEGQIQAIAQHNLEHREGVQAFLEKRAPDFQAARED